MKSYKPVILHVETYLKLLKLKKELSLRSFNSIIEYLINYCTHNNAGSITVSVSLPGGKFSEEALQKMLLKRALPYVKQKCREINEDGETMKFYECPSLIILILST